MSNFRFSDYSFAGIDIKAGKNLLGLFNDPIAIFMAVSWCQTLPQRHWTNGMAEGN